MSAVNNLLDKYRNMCLLPSDSAVADALGIKRQAVHQWRKGTSWPSDDHTIHMAAQINEPPERWLLAIQVDRASQKARPFWLKAMKSAAAMATIFVLLRHGADVHSIAAFFLSPVYIMRNVALALILALAALAATTKRGKPAHARLLESQELASGR